MFSLQRKFILFSCTSLIALALLIGLAVLPLINKIRAFSQEYLANQATLAELDQKEFLLKELEEYYQEKQTDLSALEGVFLDSREAVGFISTLETIAAETGNIFKIKTAKSFTPSAEEENGERSFLSLRISLWGDFKSLLLFLANLEDSPYPPYRLLEIDNISITRLNEKNMTGLSSSLREGDLETVLGIKIYTK
jgi:hypothetical protein